MHGDHDKEQDTTSHVDGTSRHPGTQWCPGTASTVLDPRIALVQKFCSCGGTTDSLGYRVA